MQRDLSRFSLPLGTLTVLALAGTATVGSQPALAQTGSHPCHLLTSAQSIPQGFGAAYNLFSTTKELLLDVECGSSSNATLTVGNGQNTMYIYRFGYEWVNGGWKQIALQGGELAANDWYVGTAKANLSRSQAQLAEDNFVVAYTCLWQNSSWKCGCRDTACTTNSWQLQAFKRVVASEGMAAQYPGDKGIENHPSVLLHENFESGRFNALWTETPETFWRGPRESRFTTSLADVHSGNRAFEFIMPKTDGGAGEGGSLYRHLKAGNYPILYIRYYAKYESEWNHKGSHTGGRIIGCGTTCIPGDAGNPADGTNKFGVGIDASTKNGKYPTMPGELTTYTYHMNGSNFGDSQLMNKVSSLIPKLGTWYSYELMLKVNTIGKADGEIKVWVNGALVHHLTGHKFRTTSSLAINKFGAQGYLGENTIRTNRWYVDDIVVATEYIGPMAP